MLGVSVLFGPDAEVGAELDGVGEAGGQVVVAAAKHGRYIHRGRVMATLCPLVADPRVTAPAELLTLMPLPPRVRSSSSVPPPSSVVVVVLVPRKTKPCAAWLAFKLTICAELSELMLRLATSAAPGMADGSGLVALTRVDQEPTRLQSLPLPSQLNGGGIG